MPVATALDQGAGNVVVTLPPLPNAGSSTPSLSVASHLELESSQDLS